MKGDETSKNEQFIYEKVVKWKGRLLVMKNSIQKYRSLCTLKVF